MMEDLWMTIDIDEGLRETEISKSEAIVALMRLGR